MLGDLNIDLELLALFLAILDLFLGTALQTTHRVRKMCERHQRFWVDMLSDVVIAELVDAVALGGSHAELEVFAGLLPSTADIAVLGRELVGVVVVQVAGDGGAASVVDATA